MKQQHTAATTGNIWWRRNPEYGQQVLIIRATHHQKQQRAPESTTPSDELQGILAACLLRCDSAICSAEGDKRCVSGLLGSIWSITKVFTLHHTHEMDEHRLPVYQSSFRSNDEGQQNRKWDTVVLGFGLGFPPAVCPSPAILTGAQAELASWGMLWMLMKYVIASCLSN